MQLVIGGAFAGKRDIVRKKHKEFSWVSSYHNDLLSNWDLKWQSGTTLVLEGWERWVKQQLKKEVEDAVIRVEFSRLFQCFLEEERLRNDCIVLIMLEVGRGIVPIEEDERRFRDLAGWILQDAAKMAEEVQYVWHGMAKRLK
ncbi:bifunctional adenosylcobinamide kinase/adenosylcobinamide-phosphate guanylyltransferase [Bacillus haimaensis]|uniref:bifunctional adenosylcobinamide kinase/adenosylcobinamide-phosphate guanylyltransferase n=1 Tax=Bacillus haimaensis TaxID=3160967 RepID=UPI003AA97FAB